MILDVFPEKCSGCRACEIFCSISHEGKAIPELSRIKVWKAESRNTFLPIVCPPCEDRLCMAACPEEGALRLREDGAVVVEESLCTGCSKCLQACGLRAITFHLLEGRGKRGKAVVLKCDLCDGDPWCVRVCEPGAVAAVEASPGAGRSVFARLAGLLRLAEADLAERSIQPKQGAR